MKILRIVAAGALSYFAYKAFSKRTAQSGSRGDDTDNGAIGDSRERDSNERMSTRAPLADEGERTTPHGDPLAEDMIEDDADVGGSPQSSRSFGES